MFELSFIYCIILLQILVSVRKGNDSSITVVDYVPAPVQLYDSKGVKQYPPDPERIHKVRTHIPIHESVFVKGMLITRGL